MVRHSLLDNFFEDFNMFNRFAALSPGERSLVNTDYSDYFPFQSNRLTFNKPSLDIKDDGEDLVVTIDLPGVEKENIKLRLINPRLLELICEQNIDKEDDRDNYYVRERTYGYMKRMVSLPSDVTEIDAKTSFKNGVVELRFKKIQIAQKNYLKLE